MKKIPQILVIIINVYLTNYINADSVILDFNSLPSSQGSAGPDWIFEGSGGATESQIFSIGLNGSNEPTLFQNSLGTISGQRYALTDALNPNEQNFTLDVRAAVRDEDFNSNHLGFSFFIALGGVNLNVGIGESVVQVNEQTGLRSLISGLNNTDYHDYQLTGTVGVGNSWELFRDTISIGSGNFQSAPPENRPNQLHLGDNSGGGTARVEITNFTFSQEASTGIPFGFNPGIGLSILFSVGIWEVRRRRKIKGTTFEQSDWS